VGNTNGLDPKEVLVVGGTVADIRFERNIGAMACWVRFGYGDKEECEKLGPELAVENLEEVQTLVSGMG